MRANEHKRESLKCSVDFSLSTHFYPARSLTVSRLARYMCRWIGSSLLSNNKPWFELLLVCGLIMVFLHGGATWQDCVLSDCNVAPGVVIDEGTKRADEFVTITDDERDSDEAF